MTVPGRVADAAMVLVYSDAPGVRRIVEVAMLEVSGRLFELEVALAWLDTAEEPVLDVVAEAEEAGAATTTVSGEPLAPTIVIVYGVAPGGNKDDRVTKRWT